MMEYIRFALWLLVLAPCVLSQAPIRYENDDESPITVDAGSKSLQLVWEADSDSLPALAQFTKYEIQHWNPVTEVLRPVGKVDDMTPSEVASGYSINVTKPDAYKKIVLTIDTVESKDDGAFVATAISTGGSSLREAVMKNITVTKRLSALHLQFEEREPISSKPEDAVEVTAGSYPVKCIAEGSNPATSDVKLHLDGNVVALDGEAMVEAMPGEMRQFKTTVMGNVQVEERTALFQIECVATDPAGETLSTKLDLRVLAPETQDVKCEKTKAKEGDMSVSLVCTVDHTNLNVTGLAFQFGKTGEIIQSGQKGAGNDSVEVTASAGMSTVTLTLHKAEKEHFETDFYLLITTSGGETRKEVLKLNKSDDDGGSGICTRASLGWVLFLTMAVVFFLRF